MFSRVAGNAEWKVQSRFLAGITIPVKITIVGPGAMGTLFGVFFAGAGHEVHMLDKDPAHAETLTAKGFQLEGVSGKRAAGIPVTTEPASIGRSELVLMCVKAYDTEKAAASLSPLVGPDTAVLTLQNGLGNAEALCEAVGPEHILAGSTAQGANVVEPGHVVHAGTGDTFIGELNGPATDRVRNLCKVFTDAGIPAAPSDDVTGLLWGKLIVNVGINPFTGLLQVRNGELLEHPETRELMKMAVVEAVAIAQAKGANLPFADPLAKVQEVAKKTGRNKSSMYQDIANGRRTEIDFICGAIVREAEKLSIPTPVNRTLTLLIRSLAPG
jgi:2-dehydropantoate 2-reductase